MGCYNIDHHSRLAWLLVMIQYLHMVIPGTIAPLHVSDLSYLNEFHLFGNTFPFRSLQYPLTNHTKEIF